MDEHEAGGEHRGGGETPDARRRAVVVVNPIAGRGRARLAATELRNGLGDRGVRAELIETAGPGDARARLRSLASPVDFVVSVGGDGTLGEVLDGLVDTDVPVGVLPLGTANCLARALALPRDVERALDVYTGGKTIELDVARTGSRLCFLVTGIGIDAMAVGEVERRRKGPIRMSSYVRAMLAIVRGYREPKLRVRLDGEEQDGTFGLVLAANSENYGGIFHLAADTRLDDGLFEVYLLRRASRAGLAMMALRAFLARLPGGKVQMRRARRIDVTSDQPVPVQVDGDLHGTTPVTIEVAKVRYRILVP